MLFSKVSIDLIERLFARLASRLLTRRQYRKLVGWYRCINFPIAKSYSQKGEDLLLQTFFGSEKKNGSYIDIGAFHPLWISNTKIFHDKGWRGFCYDIDQEKIDLMTKVRGSRCKGYAQAVVGEVESPTMVVFKVVAGWSDIDTLDPVTARSYEARGLKICEEVVQVIGINDVLEMTGDVDLLNIDIEGLDCDLIRHADLSKYRPRVILFEDNENWGGACEVREKLEQHGYEHLFTSGGSVAYCLPEYESD